MPQPSEWRLIKTSDRRTIVSRVVPLGLPLLVLAGHLGRDDDPPLWMTVLSCVLLVVVVIELMGVLRYRLEIGDDGIRRRRLRDDLRVSWDEVAAVSTGARSGVILVQRRDGSHLSLSGLAPAGQGEDALITAMRERAGLA